MGKGTLLIVLGLLCLSSVGAKLGSNTWDSEFGPFPSAQNGEKPNIAAGVPALSASVASPASDEASDSGHDESSVASSSDEKQEEPQIIQEDTTPATGPSVSVVEEGVSDGQTDTAEQDQPHQGGQVEAKDVSAASDTSTGVPKARNRAKEQDRTRFRKYEIDFPGEEAAEGGEVTVIERGVPSANGNMMAAGASVAQDFPLSDERSHSRRDDETSADSDRSRREDSADGAVQQQGSETDPQDDGQDSLPVEIQPPAFDGSEDFGGSNKGGESGDEEYDESGEQKHKVFDFSTITYAQIPLHHWAWLTAVVFVMLTCIISLSMIVRHLEYYGECTRAQNTFQKKYLILCTFLAFSRNAFFCSLIVTQTKMRARPIAYHNRSHFVSCAHMRMRIASSVGHSKT
jgi:hypothetical protein